MTVGRTTWDYDDPATPAEIGELWCELVEKAKQLDGHHVVSLNWCGDEGHDAVAVLGLIAHGGATLPRRVIHAPTPRGALLALRRSFDNG